MRGFVVAGLLAPAATAFAVAVAFARPGRHSDRMTRYAAGLNSDAALIVSGASLALAAMAEKGMMP